MIWLLLWLAVSVSSATKFLVCFTRDIDVTEGDILEIDGNCTQFLDVGYISESTPFNISFYGNDSSCAPESATSSVPIPLIGTCSRNVIPESQGALGLLPQNPPHLLIPPLPSWPLISTSIFGILLLIVGAAGLLYVVVRASRRRAEAQVGVCSAPLLAANYSAVALNSAPLNHAPAAPVLLHRPPSSPGIPISSPGTPTQRVPPV